MTKVAAIQFAPAFKDKAGNQRKLAKLVLEAARGGARLLVLPELCDTGYSFMSAEEARPFAECPRWMDDTMNPDTTMSVMYRLATQLNVHLVFGFVELDPGTGRLYNSQCYIAPDGTYACYQKLNRFGNDFIWAEAGKSNPPVIDSPDLGLRVGLLVCRDVRDKVNDKWTDLYSPGDADVVCLSANWGDGGFPAISWMDFVSENKTSLIVSNRYGQETCNNFGEGGICVINKAGKVFCDGLQWNQDCVVYGEL